MSMFLNAGNDNLMDENAELHSYIGKLKSALAVADDALAIIHDTNLWVHENEPTEWTQRVDDLTNNALNLIRSL